MRPRNIITSPGAIRAEAPFRGTYRYTPFPAFPSEDSRCRGRQRLFGLSTGLPATTARYVRALSGQSGCILSLRSIARAAPVAKKKQKSMGPNSLSGPRPRRTHTESGTPDATQSATGYARLRLESDTFPAIRIPAIRGIASRRAGLDVSWCKSFREI